MLNSTCSGWPIKPDTSKAQDVNNRNRKFHPDRWCQTPFIMENTNVHINNSSVKRDDMKEISRNEQPAEHGQHNMQANHSIHMILIYELVKPIAESE